MYNKSSRKTNESGIQYTRSGVWLIAIYCAVGQGMLGSM